MGGEAVAGGLEIDTGVGMLSFRGPRKSRQA